MPEFCYNLIEGVIRILIFVLYILLTSLMKEIKRVFRYHGAEHKTISCFEHGLELTVENVQKQSTIHDRCGTTFMFLVMIVRKTSQLQVQVPKSQQTTSQRT